jgi:hypothetical protein
MSDHLPAKPLPATTGDLLAQRRTKKASDLNDEVERIFLSLYEDPKFKSYFTATTVEETVEGSTAIDHTLAAEMVRQRAQAENNVLVAGAQLHRILHAVGVVERRFEISLKQRQAAA